MADSGMNIVGFVPNPETAATVVAWTQALADKDEGRIFLCYETGFDGRTAQAVHEALGEEGDSVATVTAIDDPMPVAVVLGHVRKGNSRLLVTGPFSLPTVQGKDQTSDELIRSSPCQTFGTLYGRKAPSQVKRILFIVTGDVHDLSALRLVDTLRQRQSAHVTIGAVEDESSATTGRAGESWVRGLLHDAALDQESFEIKVVADQLKHRGIVKLFEDHDLVVTGFDGASRARPLQQSLGEATVAIVKRAPPLRLRAITDWLPRINPSDLADLRYDLRLGSVWGPDFIGMLGLASAVASLGLLQNSPAVVIGSMLLAPLMTPMIGLGLALGQADQRLMRLCGKAIGLGFLLTLAVSYLIGIITPSGATLPEEVLARGGPNVLDLLIAVFSAAAATFAMARPNIVGAIAGVAIATALVPPVCAVGISLANGDLLNAFGAAALFFTNLLAIIVTSSFVFSFLGVIAIRALPRHRRLAQLGRLGLVVVLLVLAGPLSTTMLSQLEAGKSVPLAHPVTRAVANALYERVAQDEGVEIMLMARPRAQYKVMIHIASQKELPPSYADELRNIVREKMYDPQLPVSVVAVRGLWRSDSDSPPNGSP
jgi:uncharacterized hydrophobic protein (TIGR00271 family)